MEYAAVFFLLLVSHWLCDYPLQGDFLSKAKKDGPLPNYHLVAHSGIQAGGVFLVTGSLALGLAEWVLHIIIDMLKNSWYINFATDQALHIGCKVLYVAIMFATAMSVHSL